MKPTPDGLGVEIKLAHNENDLDVESGRRPSSGEASAVKDYMCCGREDDLDQGLDFEREDQGEDVGRSPKTRNHTQTTLYIEEP